MLPYLVLGIVLAPIPASGEPLIHGSLLEDVEYLHGYFRGQVLPEWRDDPRVVVDVARYLESTMKDVDYLPKEDLFVFPSGVQQSIEPGRVRMVVPLTRGGPVAVEERFEGPAVIVGACLSPLTEDPWSRQPNVCAVVGDHECHFGLTIRGPGTMVLGAPCWFEYTLLLSVGDRVVDEKNLGLFNPVEVEYWVYPDRVIMRILGFPKGTEDRAIVIDATFDLRRDRILLDRRESTDQGLISRLRGLNERWRTLLEEGITWSGELLRTRSGAEPLWVYFQPPSDDPTMRFIEKVIGMYTQGASEELRKVTSERPNIEFLFPERNWEKSEGGTSGLPVWVLPLLPVPLTGRRGGS